ncbi:crotonase/enoyl-CoA hydratase family protein [Pimelobacter simplex]|uniref:crotonase/enoyl-CoA hydratase family protein n=1 Tax=Nocardioides simplex TaxID=2045 RepID=UPI003AAAA6AC
MVYSSSYAPVDIPGCDVYTQILGSLAPADLDRTAVTDGAVDLTYRDLRAKAEALAGALAARGIGRGDIVAVQVPNSPAFVVTFFGILRAGATITTVDALHSPREIATQLADCGATTFITASALAGGALSGAAEAGLPAHAVIVVDGAHGHDSLDDLVGQGLPAPVVTIDAASDLAALPYSSGTTGMAKGVMLTHRNLVANLAQGAAVVDVGRDDKVMAVLPFSHIYGMNAIMNLTLHQRGTLVTLPRMDLPAFLELIQARRITHLYIAPPIAVALVKHPMVDDFDLSTVRQIVTAAAPMDEALGQALLTRIPATFVQGFGMTELSPISHTTPLGDHSISIGSVGTAVPNIEFKVVDLETGDEVPEVPGGRTTSGEMLVRGPNVMVGYLGNPAATAATITADGWLHTGDIVEVGPHQEVYVVDRLKELIKYKGHQVPPAELEALLLTHPSIADAAVVAYPDEDAGEIPRAFVVLQPGAAATAEEIIAWVGERIAPHKRVRIVEFIDAVPKSAAGKILRKDLRLKYAERPAVTVERRGHVLLIGLNRPEKRNAFTVEMLRELAQAYHRLETDPEIRCGVLFARGEHFTGGLDLQEVGPKVGTGELDLTEPGLRDPWRKNGTWTTPVVMAVQGWVMTLAIELLLAADIRVASSDAKFAQMEINRGIYAFGGATIRLPRDAGWGNAMRWLLTGEPYDAVEAHRIGLVQEVVEPGRQLERALQIAEQISERSAPLGVRTTLESAHRARLESEAAAFSRLDSDMARLLRTDDGREGMSSFVERRQARFTGR